MGGGQGGCERRIEVFVKIQKKQLWGGVGLGGGWGWGDWVGSGESVWGGGQDGCERSIKVFVKIQKKFVGEGGGSGGQVGVRVGGVGGLGWM